MSDQASGPSLNKNSTLIRICCKEFAYRRLCERNNMNKSQFVYVIVRLIGLAFLAYAAVCVLNLTSSVVLLSSSPGRNSFATPVLVDLIIRTLAGLAIGLYLIIDGKFVYSILDRED